MISPLPLKSKPRAFHIKPSTTEFISRPETFLKECCMACQIEYSVQLRMQMKAIWSPASHGIILYCQCVLEVVVIQRDRARLPERFSHCTGFQKELEGFRVSCSQIQFRIDLY